jgi:hypothetical protein
MGSVDAELAGGDDAERDEDGEQEELLHARRLTRAATVALGGVRAPGGLHRLQSGWDG